MTALARLRLENIVKEYPGCRANDGIDLTVAPGEIHALLGENGAGKSTLMKVIYGVIQPDEGALYWDGQKLTLQGPAHARQLGIGMVFQHFSLFETLTVAENIALGLPAGEARNRKALDERIRDVSKHYGMALDPRRFVHTLSTGERQRVEIVRCLIQHSRLLILDEPTSVLTPQEVTDLFRTLRQLADEGCSILFISHKLQEVRDLCHHATVLRHGKVTGECDPTETSTEAIARLMPFAKGVSAKSFDFDDQGHEIFLDYPRIMKIVTDAGYNGYVGIEYEGGRLSEPEGILATKRLLESLSGATYEPKG